MKKRIEEVIKKMDKTIELCERVISDIAEGKKRKKVNEQDDFGNEFDEKGGGEFNPSIIHDMYKLYNDFADGIDRVEGELKDCKIEDVVIKKYKAGGLEGLDPDELIRLNLNRISTAVKNMYYILRKLQGVRGKRGYWDIVMSYFGRSGDEIKPYRGTVKKTPTDVTKLTDDEIIESIKKILNKAYTLADDVKDDAVFFARTLKLIKTKEDLADILENLIIRMREFAEASQSFFGIYYGLSKRLGELYHRVSGVERFGEAKRTKEDKDDRDIFTRELEFLPDEYKVERLEDRGDRDIFTKELEFLPDEYKTI